VPTIHAFGRWVDSTSLSLALEGQAPWLWPFCETLHFVGLALLLGIAGYFDLRLLGFSRRVPIAVVKDFMPWAMVGFGLCLVSGLVFLISEPAPYLVSPVWWPKVACLVLAGANAVLFETVFAKGINRIAAGAPTPFAYKVIALTSLASWTGVLVFGRLLGFVGAAV
jgi:hypothetical protein